MKSKDITPPWRGVFMADQTLLNIGKGGDLNPVQKADLERQLQAEGIPYDMRQGINGTFIIPKDPAQVALEKNKLAQATLLSDQEKKQQDFLTRYTTGISTARTAAETELGLPALRETTQEAGKSARLVSGQIQDIPQTQQTIAKQVGISAPRLALRTSAETAKLQPAAQTAQRALSEAMAGQQFGETEYTRRLQEYTQPFALEASMLSDSLAREFTGFTQQMQNELTVTLQKMANAQAVTSAEIQRATELAKAEADYQKEKEFLAYKSELGVSQEQQLKNLGLGSYYQKPKALGEGTWEGA